MMEVEDRIKWESIEGKNLKFEIMYIVIRFFNRKEK